MIGDGPARPFEKPARFRLPREIACRTCQKLLDC
jgi:hypothetical protein